MAHIEEDKLALINLKQRVRSADEEEEEYYPSEYDDIIEETIRAVYIWITVASLMQFWYSCSWSVWILYGRSLGESDQQTMAIVTYFCYFIQAIFTLVWSSMGDKYTYQRIGTLLVFFISIAYLIQFLATSFIELAIGAILVAICEGTWALSIAFIAKYLPLSLSIKYTSYQYAIGTFFYVLGPIAGGLITYYATYSWCFFVSCICSTIAFIVFMIQNIHKIERRIEYKQIQFSINTEIEGMRFPICIENYTEIEDDEHQIDGININNANNGIWQSISVFNWFLLFCILIASASMFAIEAILAVWYTVFCADLYPENDDIIIISTLQIACYCLSFIVGVRIVPKLLKVFKNEKDFKFEYGVLLISQSIMIIMFGIGWNNVSLNVYWIFHIIGGFIMGIVNMIHESILLSLQPNRFAGTISGMKQFGRYMMKGIGCLIVGMLWKIDIFYWAYIQSVLYFIGIICTLLMIIGTLAKCNKKYQMIIVSDISDVPMDVQDL